ncbi:MAG: hypothetical protein M3248_06725 [Actinomycetota bacterium]|nr:hypothetical protein [Actinomycetota bacterium]
MNEIVRRILLVLTAALVMAAMAAVTMSPAFGDVRVAGKACRQSARHPGVGPQPKPGPPPEGGCFVTTGPP